VGTAVFLLVLGALALRAVRLKGGLFIAALNVKGEEILKKDCDF
jgi:hypothetical protein